MCVITAFRIIGTQGSTSNDNYACASFICIIFSVVQIAAVISVLVGKTSSSALIHVVHAETSSFLTLTATRTVWQAALAQRDNSLTTMASVSTWISVLAMTLLIHRTQ